MRYSMPGTPGGATEGDAAVLGAARSRKELRSAVEVKLVRVEAGASDRRDVEWDVVWAGDEEESEGDGDEAGRQPGEKRRVSFAVETEKRRR